MAELRARFSLIDEMSDKLSSIADKGQEVMNNWEQAGNSASSAMDGVASSASNAVSTVDGVAKSLDDLSNTANSAGANADNLSEAMNSVGNSIDSAASETDNWTSAVGSYNKEALEMVYTTEELVEMGYKTADALGNQEEMFALCEQSASQLNSAMENAVNSHEQYANSIETANEAMSQLVDSGKLTAESQERLESASQAAAQAMQELESAQAEAQAAMDNYDAVIISGTNDLGELESAAQRASTAAENLASAQDKASKATEEYSNAADNASQSAEESGAKGVDAITAISETLIAAKIAEKTLEIAKAAYELADAYSEAQEIVVNATGATGEALNSLEQSMMNAYTGHYQDLSTTAGAIGEINTRMALTGDELTDVTGLFLDYSRITGSDVVGSVQNVTKVMNQWGVDMENVENVLDRLAYAGQISGASVDSLSQTLITGAASFQEVGLSLDSAIQLLADFELAGINSSTAIMAMRTAVNNFTKDGKDAESELQNVISKIASMEDSTEATALAVDTFGSRAGQQLALAIRNGTVSVDSFNASLESADGTLRKTAEAGETLGEKWEKSNNKIKAAFTSALQPTIDKLSSSFANLMSSIGDFLNKHPAITKVIIAGGVSLGIFSAAITGVTFAANVAIPAITAFGASIYAALGPVGLIAIGATALVGGIFALTSAFSSSEDQIADYNGTMEECANEISTTEAALEKACKRYGENSEAAKALSDHLDTLNAQYQNGGGYLAELSEQAAQAKQVLQELDSNIQTQYNDLESMNVNGLQAVSMLEALSEKSNLTNSDLDLMQSYADYLNDTFNCNIAVNYETKDLTGFDPELIVAQIMKQYESQKLQISTDAISNTEFIDNYTASYKALSGAQEEYNKHYAEYEKLYNNWTNVYENSIDDSGDIVTWDSDAMNKAEEYRKKMEALDDVLAETQSTFDSYDNVLRTHADIIDTTGETYEILSKSLQNGITTFDEFIEGTEALTDEQEGIDAATTAAEQYTDEILRLSAAYDEAYQSALESMQGQFGLFDEASTASEEYLNSTVANAQKALDSQLAYWTEYQTNLETLVEYGEGLTGEARGNYEALVAYAQSGSEEAAGLAASIAASIEQGDTEAVTKLAGTLSNVDTKQKEIADLTADWSTHFSEEMDNIVNKMNTTVSELNLSSEANAAATSTINSYAAAIRSGVGNARSAAQSVVDAVRSVFNNANLSYSADGVSGAVKIDGHATGTTNAEDVFIAGEEGPELIIGKSGSTVFPNSETNKIISALHDIGGASYSNSYTTANAVTDNSAVNNYSSASENYDQTEIFNNYTNIENGSGYDDSTVIRYLDSFVSICSAIEKEVSNENDYTLESKNEIPDVVTIVDLSKLEEIISKIRPGNDVSNYDDSVIYGDTQNIDNSRSYSTKYGDNDLSRISADITNYGDVAHSFENNLRYGDKDYVTQTNNNVETSLSTSEDNIFHDVNDSIIDYGDMIRNYSDVLNYGDAVKNSDISEQTNMSKSWDSIYSSDNSRNYETAYNYKNILSAENLTEANNVNSNASQSDYSSIVNHYGDSIERHEDTISNNSLSNNSQTFENDIISAFIPMWEIIAKMLENSFKGNLSETERYYNVTERYDAESEKLVIPEIVIDYPDLTVSESESRIVEETAEENNMRIIPPEENGSNLPDNSKDGGIRRIVIEIAGSGSIDISNGVDREQVLELLQDNLKPVLMNIISNEIYEEGELSYDF